MANSENLKNIQEFNSRRTHEQHCEDARKGGINSGIARREKINLRKQLEILLEMDNNAENVTLALIKKAKSGDVQAFTALRDTIGQKPIDVANLEITTNSTHEKLLHDLNGRIDLDK